MYGKAPQQGERRALFEFVALAAPPLDLGPGVRCAVEEVEAHCVANGPVVKVFAPPIHLGARQLRWIADEGGKHSRLVHAGVPKRGGKRLVTAQRVAERLDV